MRIGAQTAFVVMRLGVDLAVGIVNFSHYIYEGVAGGLPAHVRVLAIKAALRVLRVMELSGWTMAKYRSMVIAVRVRHVA